MTEFTREPFEWVEIDQDFCSLTYGTAPCAAVLPAGGGRCYNTRITCQSPANYALGKLTLRFCKSQAFLPRGDYYIPSLRSVSVQSGKLNPIGISKSSSALGTRGGISCTFTDHAHTDKTVDKYRSTRGLVATENGTFWTKWRARNQFYLGRAIRYKTGFIENGVVIDVTTRTYFITDFSGPDSSGNVSFSGRDILSQVSNEKAKAPFASTGKCLNALTAAATSLTLDPAGVGNLEYAASGYVRLGKEVASFTRSGDVLTLVRAQYGTSAIAVKAGDSVQQCLEYIGKAPAFILEDLIKNFAKIPVAYLNLSQWAAEQTDFMPRLYSALITEPTGVDALIAEMSEQMYFYVVWNERTAKLNMRAVRPASGDIVYNLSDFKNFEKDSVSVNDLNDQLITQVWVYYGIVNPTEKANEPKNFAAREIIAALDEESPAKNDSPFVHTVFCRWIPSTNGAAAIDLGQKMLARYGSTPRQVGFTLSEKDSAIWLGDFVTVQTRLNTDYNGVQQPLNIQILSAQESQAGMRLQYTGQQFVYEKPVDSNERLIIISADQLNVNLRTLHDSLYAAPVGTERIKVIVRSGVKIGGATSPDIDIYSGTYLSHTGSVVTTNLRPWARRSASSRAFRARGSASVSGSGLMLSDMWEVPVSLSFDTGEWPAGVTLSMTVESGAAIAGEGGYGGIHSSGPVLTTMAYASDGGHAMKIRYPISINNLGVIGGGGGGGGCLSNWRHPTYKNIVFGGGGGGSKSGKSLPISTFLITPDAHAAYNRDAANGSTYDGGSGSYITTGFFGGNGGGLGVNGSVAYNSVFVPPYLSEYQPTLGGTAGNAIISGKDSITWINKGDVRGAEA